MSFYIENGAPEVVPAETADSDALRRPATRLAIVNEDEDHSCNDRTDDETDTSRSSSCRSSTSAVVVKVLALCFKYEFPLLILLSIFVAWLYPPLGAVYLAPQITASWIAVIYIFFLSGLGTKTEEFSKAFQKIGFNLFVQIYNFFVISSVVFGVTRLLVATNTLNHTLADGMVVCACLPMAINIVIVFTSSAGGNEAAAIFNTTFGNIAGIFLSPVLILVYLGAEDSMNIPDVLYKLALRVILPLIVGQVLQKCCVRVREFFVKHKRKFKKTQEYSLVFIIYTVFCKNFAVDNNVYIGDIFVMIAFQILTMSVLAVVAWFTLRRLFKDEPELCVMGIFGCVTKTIALGVPLIASIYEDSPNEALYTLPLLVEHTMQLILGSLLVPYLHKFVGTERARLDDSEDDKDSENGSATDVEAAAEEDGSPALEDHLEAEEASLAVHSGLDAKAVHEACTDEACTNEACHQKSA